MAALCSNGFERLAEVQEEDAILRRMQAHQSQKRAMLRGLRLVPPIPADAGNSG
jgi:hypothetical protein